MSKSTNRIMKGIILTSFVMLLTPVILFQILSRNKWCNIAIQLAEEEMREKELERRERDAQFRKETSDKK